MNTIPYIVLALLLLFFLIRGFYRVYKKAKDFERMI